MNKLVTLIFLVFLIPKFNANPASSRINFNAYNDPEDENSIDGSDVIDISSLGPEAYGFPNNESGIAVASWSDSSLVNPEELGLYAEGDILMPPLRGRNGVKEETLRWPRGHIPYVIEGQFNYQEREIIMKAIADYHRLTCLRFIPYNGQKDYIVIQSKNTGCWSSVGKLGGRQEVNVQAPGCVSKKGTVIHELLHAVGFMHEQSRPERDDFVTVRYNNIKPGTESNFKKADSRHTSDFGIPYDYNSVMHYSEYAFSKNQQKTIDPKVGGVKLGQREGLSRNDVKKINNMYGCKKEIYPFSGGSNQRPQFSTPNFVNQFVPRPIRYPYAYPGYPYYGNVGSYTNVPFVDRYRPRHPRIRFPQRYPEPQSGWFGNVFQNWFAANNYK